MQTIPTYEVTCQTFPRPNFRLSVFSHIPQYQIQAFPACRPQKTVVYIDTESPAVVAYVLGSDWREQLNGRDDLRYNGTTLEWKESDEEEIAMRIIRAGGTVLDTTYPEHDLDHVQRPKEFAAFSRTKKYIFGWPNNGGLWVLHLDGLVPLEYWTPSLAQWDGGFWMYPGQHEDMEREAEFPSQPRPLPDGAFDSEKLNQAETMDEYCSELRERNATFYKDPEASTEALEMGLFDKDTLTKVWDGFSQWVTSNKQRMMQSMHEDLGSGITDVPKSSGCVVA
jgi:hypothetical protein